MEGTALRVLAATAYPPSVASARVRLIGHQRFLEADRISLEYKPALSDSDYARLASHQPPLAKGGILLRSALRAASPRLGHDLLLVHRLRFLTPVPGVDPPTRLDVYDFDDALFLGSASPSNQRFGWVKREAQRCVTCLQRARLVIAGNAYLAERAKRYAQRVEVIPSCVDPDPQPVRVHAPRDVVTVGWIGSPTTSQYLRPVLPVFAQLNGRGVKAKLVIIGADVGVRAPWLEHRAWSLARQQQELSALDIGIMPQPDDEWVRGKCGYKLLQYFSAGVPAIASPVGVAPDLIGSDRGLLAATHGEWRVALERLISDFGERRERGEAARAFVEREYSYKRWAPEFARLLRSLA